MKILDSKEKDKNRIKEKDGVPVRSIEAVAREGRSPAGMMNWEETTNWSNDGNPGHNYSH